MGLIKKLSRLVERADAAANAPMSARTSAVADDIATDGAIRNILEDGGYVSSPSNVELIRGYIDTPELRDELTRARRRGALDGEVYDIRDRHIREAVEVNRHALDEDDHGWLVDDFLLDSYMMQDYYDEVDARRAEEMQGAYGQDDLF